MVMQQPLAVVRKASAKHTLARLSAGGAGRDVARTNRGRMICSPADQDVHFTVRAMRAPARRPARASLAIACACDRRKPRLAP